MDAKETIGRAVAKVKGECWHGQTDEAWVCECGFKGLHFFGWTDHTVDHPNPDYTSEGRIREAVRVLCGNDRDTKFNFAIRAERLLFPDSCESDVSLAMGTYEYGFLTAPAEVLVEALLPIAEEALKEGE